MIACQRHLFSLPEEVTYLNCAYMSPLMKKVEAAGGRGIARKGMPFEIFSEDFFKPADDVRKLFSRLIQTSDFERIALIPSVSYGIANVVKNIEAKAGQNIVMLEEQFPSNYYSWKRLAEDNGLVLRIIGGSDHEPKRGEIWNEKLMESIDNETVVVTIPIVHWADGTRFDIKAVSQKAKEVGAKLIIDGTQSIGAMPFDLSEIRPDALICSAYKWLLGPYSIGLAYYGETFDHGVPVEESWMNREKSDDFQNLVNYRETYRPKAFRFNVGELSNFILVPMLKAALTALLEWEVGNIQNYCSNLTEKFTDEFSDLGCWIEDSKFRGGHLFGIRLPRNFDIEKLKTSFSEQKVFVSLRGNAIRVSPHLYNNEADFERLLACFKGARKKVLV